MGDAPWEAPVTALQKALPGGEIAGSAPHDVLQQCPHGLRQLLHGASLRLVL